MSIDSKMSGYSGSEHRSAATALSAVTRDEKAERGRHLDGHRDVGVRRVILQNVAEPSHLFVYVLLDKHTTHTSSVSVIIQ